MVVHSQRTKKKTDIILWFKFVKIENVQAILSYFRWIGERFLYSNHTMGTGDGNCEEREWDTKKYTSAAAALQKWISVDIYCNMHFIFVPKEPNIKLKPESGNQLLCEWLTFVSYNACFVYKYSLYHMRDLLYDSFN